MTNWRAQESDHAGFGRTLVGLFVLVLLAHGVWYLAERPPTAFVDSDGYMRALRVEALWQGGGWFERVNPRVNAPYGDASHWTRPLDVLISVLALPFVPFFGAKGAIFWGGAVSGPLLHATAAVALAWAALPLIGRTGAVLAAIATITQFGIMSYGTLFRGDHHIVYVLITALGLGFAIRALDRDRAGDRNALFAGLAAAAGIWIGVEGLAFAFLSLAALGLAWMSGQENPHAAKGLRFTIGLTAGLAGMLAVESGPSFLVAEYDFISIVHLVLAAMVMSFFLAVRLGAARGKLRSPRARVAAALAGAILAFGGWASLFPTALRGPLADNDPAYVEFLMTNILELGPGYKFELFPATLGPTVIVAPWVVWRLWREKSSRWFWSWVYVGICLTAFGALTAGWVRWTIYAGLVSSLVMGDMIARITERIAARAASPLVREAGTALVVISILTGPLAATYAAGIMVATPKNKAKREWTKICSSRLLAETLARPPFSDRPRTILTGMTYGAEIVYLTPHAVVATPYRSARAWRDTVDAFTAKDDAVVREILARRDIGLIAICPGYPSEGLSIAPGVAGGFYDRLTTQPPDWVREMALPVEAEAFRVFQVHLDRAVK